MSDLRDGPTGTGPQRVPQVLGAVTQIEFSLGRAVRVSSALGEWLSACSINY